LSGLKILSPLIFELIHFFLLLHRTELVSFSAVLLPNIVFFFIFLTAYFFSSFR